MKYHKNEGSGELQMSCIWNTLICNSIRVLIACSSYSSRIFTALADGALDPVLTMCAMKEAMALLALMTLSHIVEHQGNLAPLIEVSTC